MPRGQQKLLAAMVALVALVLVTVGLPAARELAEREVAAHYRALEERARLATELLEPGALRRGPSPRLTELAERVAAVVDGIRVVFVAPDGTVVADSSLPPSRVGDMENHAARPEVAAALAGRVGRHTRESASVGRPQRYAAVPAPGGGAVRVSADPARGVGEALRGWLLQGAVAGLLGALLLSYAWSWLTARSLERMRTVAASVAGGDLSQRIRRHSGDELDAIAGAIDQMAEQLRLRLEEATHEKERLHAVLNGMVEGVLVVDTGGKIVLVNQRARAFFDVGGPAVSRSVLEVIRNAELDDVLTQAARTDEPVGREIRLAGPGERVLRMHAVRFPAAPAPRMGTVAVFHDVTEIVRLEQVRRDFVANASHELRTPLTAISGFAETLLASQKLSREDQRAYLEVIDRHAQRLTHIVSDLLELSKIESQKVDLESVSLDVAGLAERLLADYHERFQDKDLLASVERRGDPVARADARACEQVLINLVDNAIKYTEPGGSVTVRVEAEGNEVAVSVVDTGIGIPPEDRERIFERFYRVDKARSRELGGTGLGLSIVKHLVQNQGGEISVRSTPGQGSTFRFTLPRASAAT